VVRIVGAAIPVEGFLLLFAALAPVGPGYGVQEVIVAWRAAAILRRAAPLTAEELEIEPVRFGGLNALDDDPMLPVVAHVVDIPERLGAAVERFRKFGRAGALDLASPTGVVGIGDAVDHIIDRELPEVIVEPAHGGLDDLVQGLKVGRAAHGDAPPDHRLDIGQFDAQDGEVFRAAHAASLAAGRSQFQGKSSARRLIGWPLAMRSMTSY